MIPREEKIKLNKKENSIGHIIISYCIIVLSFICLLAKPTPFFCLTCLHSLIDFRSSGILNDTNKSLRRTMFYKLHVNQNLTITHVFCLWFC